MEKPNSAQVGPLSSARACVTSVPDKRAPPIGANSSAPSLPLPLSLSLSLSLAALWGRPVGSVSLAHALASLSIPPTPPVSRP
jgi:hypothetical protein